MLKKIKGEEMLKKRKNMEYFQEFMIFYDVI